MNVNKWDTVETCLLEMLPVKNVIFRRLQEMIENLDVCPGMLIVSVNVYDVKQMPRINCFL